MKTKGKIVSIFILVAAIACFGISLRLKIKKDNIDISKGWLSEKVDRQMALLSYVYLFIIIGIILLLVYFIIQRKRKKISN